MRFSLILATLGDGRDIPRFLNSLLHQGDTEFELVVVDQNADDRLVELVRQNVWTFPVRHIRASPGLSSSRNIGMAAARGEVLGFPDDDCWYPVGFLPAVDRALRAGLDGLTCRCADPEGRLAAGGEGRRSGLVTKRNVWNRGVSATMFLNRSVVRAVGRFDQSLGLGSGTAFQSGEETDYLLRCLRQHWSVGYRADLTVHHPLPPDCRHQAAAAKSRAYGRGMGRVLRMHGHGRFEIARHLGAPLAGAAWALLSGDPARAKVRVARALGRWEGWRWTTPDPVPSDSATIGVGLSGAAIS